MKSRLFLLIIFPFLFAVNSIAQQKELKFKNYTQEEGLPSNESYFVYRDSKNFIWIATDQGVVRYNGNKMEHYNLPDNVIFKIREDSKGRIWFFSHTGQLAYFFGEKIYPYQYNDSISKYIKTILITNAYVNDNDEVIMNADGNLNYKISKAGAITKYYYVAIPGKDSNLIHITKINENNLFASVIKCQKWFDQPYNLQVTIDNNPFIFNVKLSGEYFQHYGCIRNKDLFLFVGKCLIKLSADGSYKVLQFNSNILCLETSGNNIWVGLLKKGAVLVNSELEQVDEVPAFKNLSITSIANDYEGGTWFSSLENGVFYLKSIHVYNLKEDSSLAQPVFRMYNLADTSFLFANAQGLYKFSQDRLSSIFIQNNELISDILIDSNKNCFLVGRYGLVSTPAIPLVKMKRIENPDIKNVVIVNSSSELIGIANNENLFSQGDAIVRFNIENIQQPIIHRALSSRASFLFSDFKKQIWVGSINKINKLNSTFTEIIPFKDFSSFFQKGVTCMNQMDNGLYCIGIRFGGIVIMQDTNIIANISQTNGLLSNSIKSFLPLKDQLWAATSKGISVIQFSSYNPLKYTITNIGKNEGFYNQIIYQLMLYQNNILAATSNGIYVIENTNQFLKQHTPKISFYINAVNYYMGDTTGISAITVPYKNNRLKITYSAICFNSPEEIKYYYRFDKNDTTWQTTTNSELLLENLSPGIYDLELRAGIPNQQRFSDIQELKITIQKPWWQNNWLRLAGILLLAAIVFLVSRNRINKIRKKEEQKSILNTRMVELEQTALRSQMNPHFIFNCLTSIQQLIITGKTTDANEYLVKFARLIRKTLDLSSRPYIKIIEEKEYLDEYLFLEQLRIPGQFDYTIIFDPHLDINKTEIPNMMLQPIVENCIRHGIKHLENRKGQITVSIQKKEDFIFCSVIDNGVGRNGLEKYHKNLFVEQKSYGMYIVRKRLELMTETRPGNFFVEIKDLQNPDGTAAGTEVIMQLPFKISTA